MFSELKKKRKNPRDKTIEGFDINAALPDYQIYVKYFPENNIISADGEFIKIKNKRYIRTHSVHVDPMNPK